MSLSSASATTTSPGAAAGAQAVAAPFSAAEGSPTAASGLATDSVAQHEVDKHRKGGADTFGNTLPHYT